MSLTRGERTRFPKIEEMAHFHYDTVDFSSPLQMCIYYNNEPGKMIPDEDERDIVKVLVSCRERSWVISRSLNDFVGLDMQFHKCVYDRNFSGLESLSFLKDEHIFTENLKQRLVKYMDRLSSIAGNAIWCGPILNWFEVDNKGNHLMLTEDSAINVPAVAAAHVIKRYTAQASDEISFEVGDIVSVIDMPPVEESSWWRGKREFEVGFFPSQCVKVIGDNTSSTTTHKLTPVASKRGKVVSYLRAFLSSRPSRVKMLQSGILRARTFGCDLGEHLHRTEREIPLVVEMCAKMIEEHGITNGVYRHSGMSTNVQKIRLMFDSEESPDIEQDCFLRDIHCVGNVLKMYFRELPNPLLTYHLYEKFTNAVSIKDGFDREIAVHHVVQQLPPLHYKTVEFLLKHLAKLASYEKETGMHAKNLSIVWAPNLMRKEKIEDSSCTLQHLGSQAVVVEYLIRNVNIFFDKDTAARAITRYPLSPKTLTRERSRSDPSFSDSSDSFDRSKIRPASVGVSPPPKLISLEEARTSRKSFNVAVRHRHGSNSRDKYGTKVPLAKVDSSPDLSLPEMTSSEAVNPLSQAPGNPIKPGKTYIDVGEGPDALPEFHTVIELPRKKQNFSRNSKRWKSFFVRRPDSSAKGTTQTSATPSSVSKKPPMRQRSYEDAIKKIPENGLSKSVDELLHRNQYNPQQTIANATSSKSKFYIEHDLPHDGTAGTYVQSRMTSPDSCVVDTTSQKHLSTRTQPPPRPMSPPQDYLQRKKKSTSPVQINGDDSAFFLAGQ
ncbi:rho GTPase-activating protein 32-like isoform X2 [Xenia sp. Carnegie-2017]|nr:rho GTPase-activating protein 32-like isoform X2 [Xenia sp. Carnegie-2017]